MQKTYIIAEAGVNHNGSLNIAKQLVQCASECKADAIKFQLFEPELIVTQTTPKADYQRTNTQQTGSQLEMLSQLCLSQTEHLELANYCKTLNIDYMCSPFDLNSAYFLCNTIDLPVIKLGSGELTNAPLLYQVASSGKRIILSTGMATLEEIETALGVLALAYKHSSEKIDAPPLTEANFKQAFSNPNNRELLKEKLSLLHCTTEYPCPFEEVNLNAMDILANTFKLPIGFSDHTSGISVAMAAVAKGAQIIEKHFTLDKNQQGPDHKASINPIELSQLVKGIREIEYSLGQPIKAPTNSELENKHVVRKYIVASKAIKKGDLFSKENIYCKRSGGGLSPIHYWKLLGSIATQSYQLDDVIRG